MATSLELLDADGHSKELTLFSVSCQSVLNLPLMYAFYLFILSTVQVPNLTLVETKRIKVHRCLTPNSDWLAGCNKSSEPVLQSYFLDNFSVNSVSQQQNHFHFDSQR
jgi:hypothetical protein